MTRTICTYVHISILFVEFWYKQCHIAACKMVDYTDDGKCRCKTSKETFNVASAYEQFQQRWWNRQARSTGPQLTHHTTHFTCRFQHWQMAVLLVLCRHYLCPFSLTGVSATTPENLVPRLPYHPGEQHKQEHRCVPHHWVKPGNDYCTTQACTHSTHLQLHL